jgi:adenine-specific DNA-methyltransferase
MDKLKMHTPNLVEENIEKIAAMFPNAVTERIIGYKEEARPDGTHEPIMQRAIDFDVLRQELSDVVVDGPAERYAFIWPDKRRACCAANAPIAKPCVPAVKKALTLMPPKTSILRATIWTL